MFAQLVNRFTLLFSTGRMNMEGNAPGSKNPKVFTKASINGILIQKSMMNKHSNCCKIIAV